LLPVFGFVLAAACAETQSEPAPVKREVISRGPNVRATGVFEAHHRDTPPAAFGPADCEAIGADFGLNAMRLTLSWSLIEPARGRYAEAVLDKIESILSACHAWGIAVLLDLHQDGYSKYVGIDGAPHWAHVAPLPPGDESQPPSAAPSETVTANFAELFRDGSDLGQAYAAMLAHVTARLGRHPAVLGIELINEPISPGKPEVLFGFYGRMSQAIRKVNPRIPIFMEPSAERNVLDRAELPEAVPFADTRGVYAPHLYTGVFAFPWRDGDRRRIEKSLVGMGAEAQALDMPLFVGEWGGPNDATGRAWSNAAVALFDQYKVSWTNWVYDEPSAKCADQGPGYCTAFYHLTGDPARPTALAHAGYREDAVAVLARPFPRRVAGSLARFAYDAAAKTLTVQGDFDGEHELSAPRLVFAKGALATCDGQAAPTTAGAGYVRLACRGKVITLRPR
jgi:endoglycosylceramidase